MTCFIFQEGLLQLLKRNTVLAFFLRGLQSIKSFLIFYKGNGFKLNEKKVIIISKKHFDFLKVIFF